MARKSDPNKLRLDPRLAERLARKKTQLDRLRPLPPDTVRRLNEDLHVFLTYHSNAIEGNSLIDGEGKSYDPVIRAAIAHHGFEAVHPFEDGNGHVGRLLLNLTLMRESYPPALILRGWRALYPGTR